MQLQLDEEKIGKDSATYHMCVEFVVGPPLCPERFFSGYMYSGFPHSSKTNTSKFQFDLESVPN